MSNISLFTNNVNPGDRFAALFAGIKAVADAASNASDHTVPIELEVQTISEWRLDELKVQADAIIAEFKESRRSKIADFSKVIKVFFTTTHSCTDSKFLVMDHLPINSLPLILNGLRNPAAQYFISCSGQPGVIETDHYSTYVKYCHLVGHIADTLTLLRRKNSRNTFNALLRDWRLVRRDMHIPVVPSLNETGTETDVLQIGNSIFYFSSNVSDEFPNETHVVGSFVFVRYAIEITLPCMPMPWKLRDMISELSEFVKFLNSAIDDAEGLIDKARAEERAILLADKIDSDIREMLNLTSGKLSEDQTMSLVEALRTIQGARR